jgi:hypothetical protein
MTQLKDTLDITNELKNLDDKIQEIRSEKSEISLAIADVNNVISGLRNDSFSVSKWLGDEVFRPGNKKRKETAIAEMQGLVEELITLDRKVQELLDHLHEMKLLMRAMKDWTASIVELIPVFSFSMSVPQFSTTLDEMIRILEYVGTLAVMVFLKYKAIKLFSLKASAYFVVAAIVFELIAGIIQGEERKKKFEEIANDAREKRKEVRVSIDNVDESIQNIRLYFINILKVYQNAGLTEEQTTEVTRIREIVESSKSKFMSMQNDFKNAEKFEAAGMAPKDVANILAGQDQDKRNALLAGSLIRRNSSIDEITKELNVSPAEARKARATALLLEGKSPQEIARTLEVSTDDLERIVKMDSFQSVLEIKEKVK